MARRRDINVFSLSFLDIMSCGFGAVILIYIVINHATETTSQEINLELLAEISKIEEAVFDGQEKMVRLKNTIKEVDDETVTTDGLATEILTTIKELKRELAELDTDANRKNKTIEELKKELQELEEESDELKGSVAAEDSAGQNMRSFSGEGDRQYLTGLKMGGKNILILMDRSASMLDERIVNVIRLRNMPVATRMESEKWQRAIRTTEWITSNIPRDSEFQLYTFNTQTSSIIADSTGKWLKAADGVSLNLAIEKLKETLPENGTDLSSAFAAIRELKPLPDNIFLLIDSLPTRSINAPRGNTVESTQRVGFFQDSIDYLPIGIPVNVILFPMEGDPLATPSYWQLAQLTGGSFLSPPKDWP